MEQVTIASIATFGELNQRLSVLISNTVQQKFGTPDERKFMTVLTNAGIESAKEMIDLINEGLTYEIWKAFLDKKNSLEGPLGLFENEAGDMAAIVKEFRESDLRAAYDQFMADGVFTVETIQNDIKLLQSRKEWAEALWGREDVQTVKHNELLETVKMMDAEAHNELVRHGDPEYLKELDDAAKASCERQDNK